MVGMVDGIGVRRSGGAWVVEGVMKLVSGDMSGLTIDGQMLVREGRKEWWRNHVTVVAVRLMMMVGRVENGQGSGRVRLLMVAFFSGQHNRGRIVPFVVQHVGRKKENGIG